MENETQKLRKCPFCCSDRLAVEPILVQVSDQKDIQGYSVHCALCHARGSVEEKKETAMESWNWALRAGDIL